MEHTTHLKTPTKGSLHDVFWYDVAEQLKVSLVSSRAWSMRLSDQQESSLKLVAWHKLPQRHANSEQGSFGNPSQAKLCRISSEASDADAGCPHDECNQSPIYRAFHHLRTLAIVVVNQSCKSCYCSMANPIERCRTTVWIAQSGLCAGGKVEAFQKSCGELLHLAKTIRSDDRARMERMNSSGGKQSKSLRCASAAIVNRIWDEPIEHLFNVLDNIVERVRYLCCNKSIHETCRTFIRAE